MTSVTVRGPFDDRAERVSLLDVLEEAGLGAAQRFARVECVDLLDRLLRVGHYGGLVRCRASPRLLAFGADHQPVLTGE